MAAQIESSSFQEIIDSFDDPQQLLNFAQSNGLERDGDIIAKFQELMVIKNFRDMLQGFYDQQELSYLHHK